MAFEPDIIVTSPGGFEITLVVDVKIGMADFPATERLLKKYMASMRCPVGMLVTPEEMWLYRNGYLDSEDSVELVGQFDMRQVINFDRNENGSMGASQFETAVQSWLENLETGSGLRGLPQDLRNSVEQYVLPSLWDGMIRAAHPR